VTVTLNPLVAARTDAPPGAWTGVWIAEDIALLRQGVAGGSWIDTSLGGLSAGLDSLALASDPLGALLQYGVSWIVEHVHPLTTALDSLAGDPAQITAQAHTWRNVAGVLHGAAADAERAARRDVAGWSGAAADAYREAAGRQHAVLDGLCQAAAVMAAVVDGAGVLIATVRTLVRDAIAACVARLIAYAVEELASFGLATPLVVEQVTTLVAAWAARIARWLRALLDSLRRLRQHADRLAELVGRLDAAVRRERARPRIEPLTAADENALQYYTTSYYAPMNRCLRDPGTCTGPIRQRAEAVSVALAKLSPEPAVTYRGVQFSADALAAYRPGRVVTERGFTSTSLDVTVAQGFGGNTLLVIEGRTGRNVAPYSMYASEAEILYDKGTRFRVLDRVLDTDSDQWIITLEEA
jgi:hypothetical protein